METLGRRLLADALKNRKETQASLAGHLGLHQSSVSLWMSGKARPEPEHRKALEILYAIPADAWLTIEEQAVVERSRALAAESKGAA